MNLATKLETGSNLRPDFPPALPVFLIFPVNIIQFLDMSIFRSHSMEHSSIKIFREFKLSDMSKNPLMV